jgi:hypothetical protein
MNKEIALRLIKLMSIFETLGLMSDRSIPDYLFDELSAMKVCLENIIMDETNEN